MKKIKRWLNLHFDISSLVIILLLVSLVYRPLLNFLFLTSTNLTPKLTVPEWVEHILLKVLCEIIAAAIILPLVFYLFRVSSKSMLTGKFTAFDIIDGKDTEWGTVTLTYNMFSNRIKGVLTSVSGDADLHIDAAFERGSYLRGHYIEKKKLTSRRMGAFLLMLDGEGDNYSGSYVFVDPDEANGIPKEGKAKWIKKS